MHGKIMNKPRYGCKTVSSIIYVVGENSLETVAWRIKSVFLGIKTIRDKVHVSSFFFPHPPTSPLLPTLPPVFFFSHTDCSDICFLPRMCYFFCENDRLIPFREALFLYLLPTWLGWGWRHLQSPGLAVSHAWLAEVQDSSNYGDWLEMGRHLRLGQSEPTCGCVGITGSR